MARGARPDRLRLGCEEGGLLKAIRIAAAASIALPLALAAIDARGESITTVKQGQVSVVIGSSYTISLTSGEAVFAQIATVLPDEIVAVESRHNARHFAFSVISEIHPGDSRPPIATPPPATPEPPMDSLTISFDRFKNETTIQRTELRSSGCEVALSLFSVRPGHATHSDSALLVLSAHSDGWRFMYGRESLRFITILDGRRTEPEKVSWDGRIAGGGVLEFLDLHITAKRLLEIARAKTADFQIGTAECTLDSDTKLKISEFAQKISEK